MSERESFITRWSRRKRATPASRSEAELREGSDPRAFPLPTEGNEPLDRADGSSAQTRRKAEPVVDLANLPSIDSITARSDVSAFLAPGVPVELTRAALRRAWAVDPAIRDFIGLSENSWDFNAPGAMAGFGPLEMTDELRRRIAQFVGRNIAGTADEAASKEVKDEHAPVAISAAADDAAPQRGVTTESILGAASLPRDEINGAMRRGLEPPQERVSEKRRRPHGGALPKLRDQ
jgi:Protein of unknown function (DUF3306)